MFTQMKKAAVAVAVSMAFSTGAFAQATISNANIAANVNASGTFSSLSYTGDEFVNWGTPMSYYWLNSSDAGSPFVADNASSTNPLAAMTSGGGTVSFTAASGGLVFNQTVSLIGSKAVVTVVLSNESGSAISGVQWGVGIDPDQGMPGTYATRNKILGQAGNAAVIAHDGFNGVTLRNTTSSLAYDMKAYIDSTCCSPVDPNSILTGATQAVGTFNYGDYSINLAYDIGTIASGTSASIGYEYVFAPVPEPEIYAMMAAGLGLMGFVARRRKKFEDAVV